MPEPALRREPPLHVQIRNHYAELIEHDKLTAGDKLPPVRDLTRIWEVAHNTAALAVKLLAAEGLVRTRGRAGTFVTGRKPSHAESPAPATDRAGR